MIVLDLKLLMRRFLADDLNTDEIRKDTAANETVIKAIDGFGMTRQERQDAVYDWLKGYSVLRSISANNRDALLTAIMDYADGREATSGTLSREAVLPEFLRLQRKLSPMARMNPTTSRRHELTSLPSKVLWCCYPDSVPIYDGLAANALRVISRICGIQTAVTGNGYAAYIDVWFKILDEVEPVMTAEALGSYPFKLRALDWLLWRLGQPTFSQSKS